MLWLEEVVRHSLNPRVTARVADDIWNVLQDQLILITRMFRAEFIQVFPQIAADIDEQRPCDVPFNDVFCTVHVDPFGAVRSVCSQEVVEGVALSLVVWVTIVLKERLSLATLVFLEEPVSGIVGELVIRPLQVLW
jgi:hypothetical protein